MSPADAVRDALAALALAGYDPTPSGLVEALSDLGEARSLLAQWQADGETVAVMQGARAHLDRARAHRMRYQPRVVSTAAGGPGLPQSADYVGPGWPDGGVR